MRMHFLAAALLAAGLSWSSLVSAAGPDAAQECAARGAPVFGPVAAMPDGDGVSLPGYTPVATKAKGDVEREMRELNDWLVAEAAPMEKGAGSRVSLTRQDLYDIGEIACTECDQVKAQERRLLVGVAKAIGLDVDFGRTLGKAHRGAFARGGMAPAADGGFTWTTTVGSPGAHALRVGFAGLDLPDDVELYVYNARGEAHGPYTGRGSDGTGNLVSNMITGDTATVQLRYYGTPSPAGLARTRFTIAEVGHIGGRFLLARTMNSDLAVQTKAFCDYNADCVVNGECSAPWSAIGSVRQGVAHMLFQSGGGFYICSGGLMGNTSNNGRPLFLTANHCISRATEAGSLETFWDYRAASCSSFSTACNISYADMRTTYPRTLGATLLAHGTAGDYSLMELAATPPGTRTFLGFNTNPVSSTATALYRLSHPGGAPQAYSSQNSDPNSFVCQTLSRGPFIYSKDTAGATEGGSSGSPILTASGQVVGQLYGACGSNLNDVCDENANRTVDGALASYYPNVSAYLAPGGGGGGSAVHVTGITLSREAQNGGRTRGVATVTVRNASNAAVSGVAVSGQFSGFYSGTASGTTDASGVAVLRSGPKKGSGAVNFCVTGLSGTYDSGANTETCDTLN